MEKGLKKGLTLRGRDGILTKLSERAAVERLGSEKGRKKCLTNAEKSDRIATFRK